MTVTDPDRTTQAPASNGRRAFLAGQTEARPGIVTTEMWLTLFTATVLVIAGYVSGAFDVSVAWALAAGVVASYVLSRGFAKAGSREGPFVIGGGDDRGTSGS